jgi:ABC-type bacteriocin/lantibiotic exporter with double-glycine peptidase domain
VFHDLEDSYGRYHSYQIDAVKGIETVKALGGESAFRRLLLDEFLGVSQKIFKTDFTAMSYEGAIEAVTFLGLGLFLWAGTYQVLGGSLSIGGPAISASPSRTAMSSRTRSRATSRSGRRSRT